MEEEGVARVDLHQFCITIEYEIVLEEQGGLLGPSLAPHRPPGVTKPIIPTRWPLELAPMVRDAVALGARTDGAGAVREALHKLLHFKTNNS